MHGRAYNRNADARRDVVLRAAGYTVLRFSADDVQSRGGWVREMLLRENSLMLTG